MKKTVEIPEGYEARIEGNKVILERKDSEDERIRKELIEFLDELWHLGKNTNFDRWGKADCAKWIAYLERQKEQKPAEWSEEDKQTIRDAINRIGQLDHYWNRPTDEKLIERLKSLRPQSHWKPSEEQMEELLTAIEYLDVDGHEDTTILDSLYKDLRKNYSYEYESNGLD